MNNLGWKRVRDKSDDTVRLRWCEVKSSINYTAFKEGWLYHFVLLLFTALHGMQTRSCDENSVRLSVCLSVKRVNCDKTGESYV